MSAAMAGQQLSLQNAYAMSLASAASALEGAPESSPHTLTSCLLPFSLRDSCYIVRLGEREATVIFTFQRSCNIGVWSSFSVLLLFVWKGGRK